MGKPEKHLTNSYIRYPENGVTAHIHLEYC